MRTLLMLGGSDIQVHAIERARNLGVRVVTCDDRPSNPGHRIAHEYHEISTTDFDGVLRLAQDLEVDGVLAYASDPAALTAAHVSETLGLPGDPCSSVRCAQDKLLLRAAQRASGLPTPAFVDASDRTAIHDLVASSPAGIAIKPTDASGSKGVTLVPKRAKGEALTRAVEYAKAASPSGRVIAEQIWGLGTQQFGGDVLVWRGEVVSEHFGDQIMSTVANSNVPIGVLCPTTASPHAVLEARRQVTRMVSALGLQQGVYNVEFRTDADGRLTIVDFGARIGGNLLGIVHRLTSGVDLVSAAIRMALGEAPPSTSEDRRNRPAGHLVIHGRDEGTFKGLEISEALRSIAFQTLISARPGDPVRPYRTSADRLGVIVMTSRDRSLLESVYRDPSSHCSVVFT